MYLAHVYPLTKGVAPRTLTYFSRKEYPRGALVHAPIRGTKTPCIVHTCEVASAARTRIRRAGHAFSSVPTQTPSFPFAEEVIRAAERLGALTITSPGALLASILPSTLCDPRIAHTTPHHLTQQTETRTAVLQAPRDARAASLHALWGEKKARGENLLVVVPHRHAVRAYADMLAVDECICLHGGLSAKTVKERVRSMHAASKPRLFIVSAGYWALPLSFAHAIFLDAVGSPRFREEKRPYTDTVLFIEEAARQAGLLLVVSDSALPSRWYARIEEKTVREYAPRVRTLTSGPQVLIANRTAEAHAPKEPLSPHTEMLIRAALQERHTLFMFAGRRGLATSVLCGDCRSAVSCARCGAPITLSGPRATLSVPRFFCKNCALARDSREACNVCGSWKLVALGLGSERIEALVRAHAPEASIVRLDTDTAPTDARAMALLAARPHAYIYIGTERALPFLPPRVHTSALVGFDAALSLPDIDAGEELWNLLLHIRERTEKTMLIETRLPSLDLLQAVADGAIEGLARREMRLRRILGFPPYTVQIDIARFGERVRVQKDMATLAKLLAPHTPAFCPVTRFGKRGTAAVLYVQKDEWPHAELAARLASLPPSFAVRVSVPGFPSSSHTI